jgi:uncharacterized protein
LVCFDSSTGAEGSPDDYFRWNVHSTFIDEANVIGHLHEALCVENVVSSDYPYPIRSWPNSQLTVERVFGGVSDEDRRLVCTGNAARVGHH